MKIILRDKVIGDILACKIYNIAYLQHKILKTRKSECSLLSGIISANMKY